MIYSFLMLGQSNMAGRGKLNEVEKISNPRLLMLRGGRWVELCEPVNRDRPFAGVGPAPSFAACFLEKFAKDGGSVGLIPCADGGSNLDDWRIGGKLFDNAVSNARLALQSSTLAGILWHQGESDCAEERAGRYAE